MASTAIRTTSRQLDALGGTTLASAYAGARLWALVAGGTVSSSGVRLLYSDNDGGSWTDAGQVDSATASRAGSLIAYQIAGAWHLAIAVAAGNGTTGSLVFRALHSNVATGTPGALTTAITLDAGGTGAGVQWPSLFHTPTASNPRLWIVAMKTVDATPTRQTRAWYAPEGTGADTGGNWSTTNFTNLGGGQNTVGQHGGAGAYRGLIGTGSTPRATIVYKDPTGTPAWKSVTFDPSVTTPTPGSAVTAWSGMGSHDHAPNGPQMSVVAVGDRLLAALFGNTAGAVRLMSLSAANTWSTPSGWGDFAGSHPVVARLGSNAILAYSSNATFATAATLKYRHVNLSTDAMGAATDLSDSATNQGISPDLAADEADELVAAVWVAGTASPFTVRRDTIAGLDFGGTAPAPGAVTDLRAVAAGSKRVDLSWTFPTGSTVVEFTIRRTTGTPPDDASDGTQVVPWSAATPGALDEVTDADAALVDGSEYFYGVQVRNADLVVGPMVTVRAVPRAPLTKLSPVGGATVTADPMFAASVLAANVDPGRTRVHFRFLVGAGEGDDAQTLIEHRTTRDGVAGWQFDDGGTWTALPAEGLDATEIPTAVRYQADLDDDGDYWWDIQESHGAV